MLRARVNDGGHRDVDMVQHVEKSSLSYRWTAAREKLLGQLAPTSWEDGRGRGFQLQRRSHRGSRATASAAVGCGDGAVGKKIFHSFLTFHSF